MKAEYAGYTGGAYPKKKKKSVADQFTTVKYRSETYCWTQKLYREYYGVDKYLSGTFFFNPAEI
jgi:hypothetical protein